MSKKHFGDSWDGHYDKSGLIEEIEKLLSKTSSTLINHKSIRDVLIDDDKLRFCSRLWNEVGYPRKKGLESFGPVLNILCQSPTGLFGSISTSGFKESSKQTIMLLLQRFCNVECQESIDLN